MQKGDKYCGPNLAHKPKAEQQILNLTDMFSGQQEDNFVITENTIQLVGEITPESVNDIIKFIVQANFPPQDMVPFNGINLIVNSRGGCLESTFAVISTIKASTVPVQTIAMGSCMSGGLMIAMSGDSRLVDKHCSIMSHTLATGYPDHAKHADLKLWMADVKEHTNKLVQHYMEHTSLTEKKIRSKLLPENGDVYLSSEKAIKYNLFDTYFTSFGQFYK